MAVSLRPGRAPVGQPGVELLVALRPQPRREEPLADRAHLVLDLALLPARGGRAGDGIDEVVPAHLLEAPVVGALLAREDRVHRRLHVVVDPAGARPAEEGEGLVVRVEHHLLRLARIGPHEQHPAVAEPDMRHLHRRGHAVDDHDLMAPVELARLARREAERNVGRGRRLARPPLPGRRVSAHRVVAALVAQPAKLLEDPEQGHAFPARPGRVRGQQPVQLLTPGPDLRLGLRAALVGELRLLRADHLAHRLPRHPQLAADRLDRLPLDEISAADLRDRLHNQHPDISSRATSGALWTPSFRGVPFGRRSAPKRGPYSMPIHTWAPGKVGRVLTAAGPTG